ncbi:MAG: ribosome-binding factor A [Candidatus Moraniibacteriota bacterium]
MSDRIKKINELIGQELSLLFEREISLKAGVFITITSVDTTRDLRYTRISVSVFPEMETEYALATLSHERKHLQRALHKKLVMKIKPALSFLLNTTEREADVVEKLLKKIAEESHKE